MAGISNSDESWYAKGGLITGVGTGSLQYSTTAAPIAASVSATARSVELKDGWIGQIVVGGRIVWESKRTWRTKTKALVKTQERIRSKFSAVFS